MDTCARLRAFNSTPSISHTAARPMKTGSPWRFCSRCRRRCVEIHVVRDQEFRAPTTALPLGMHLGSQHPAGLEIPDRGTNVNLTHPTSASRTKSPRRSGFHRAAAVCESMAWNWKRAILAQVVHQPDGFEQTPMHRVYAMVKREAERTA